MVMLLRNLVIPTVSFESSIRFSETGGEVDGCLSGNEFL